jgi:hypothetical protein
MRCSSNAALRPCDLKCRSCVVVSNVVIQSTYARLACGQSQLILLHTMHGNHMNHTARLLTTLNPRLQSANML